MAPQNILFVEHNVLRNSQARFSKNLYKHIYKYRNSIASLIVLLMHI